MGAAVSAIDVAAAASAECWERISTSSCPSPQAASASAATSTAVWAVVAANTSAIRASRLRSAAVSPAADLRLERQQPPERLDAGQPADQARGGGLELEPQAQLPIELAGGREHVLAGGDGRRQLGGQEAHHRQAEGRVRALGRAARQALRLLHAAGRLGHAGGRLGRAELEQDRPPQRGGRLLLERPAQESHRVVGRAAVAGASRRRRERVERPLLTDRAGGADGQQVGGGALAPSRVARQRTSGGQMAAARARPAGSSPRAPAG